MSLSEHTRAQTHATPKQESNNIAPLDHKVISNMENGEDSGTFIQTK